MARSKVLHLHLDESGGFEGAQGPTPLVMAILGFWADQPAPAPTRLWNAAWDGRAPPLETFHATDYRHRDRLKTAAGKLVAAWAPLPMSVVTARWFPGGQPPPHYLEMLVEAVVVAALEALAARPGGLEGSAFVIRVECAYRQGFNTYYAEKLIQERVLARARARGIACANVSASVWVTDVSRSALLIVSDLLGNVAFGEASLGPVALRPETTLSLHDPAWRLDASALALLRGKPPVASAGMTTVRPSPPAGGTRPCLLDLYEVIAGEDPADAAAWIAGHAAPESLQPEERAAVVEEIVDLGDTLVEQQRAWETAGRALALARDLAEHPEWSEDWTEAVQDRVSLRIDSLALVLANHQGVVIATAADLPRARRLLAADDDTARVLLHHNRACVNLTNAFRFDEAFERLSAVLTWLEGREAASPFGGRSVPLAQYLGTAGQLWGIRATLHGEPAWLDEAERCFREAMRWDSSDGHEQRQRTYLVHVDAERARVAGVDRGDHLGDPETAAAVERVLEAPGSPRVLSDTFRLHAVAKWAVVTGRPIPWAADVAAVLGRQLPMVHPWPLLGAWVHVGLCRDGREDPGLAEALRGVVAEPGLIALLTHLVMLDRELTAEDVAAIEARVPQDVRPGWVASGISGRVRVGRKGSEVVPFNFC